MKNEYIKLEKESDEVVLSLDNVLFIAKETLDADVKLKYKILVRYPREILENVLPLTYESMFDRDSDYVKLSEILLNKKNDSFNQ